MLSFTHYFPDLQDIEIHPDEVLDILREQDRSPDNPVVSETNEVFETLSDIIELRGGYVIFEDFEILPQIGKIRINDRLLTPQKKISGYMKEAEKIAIFICTAGEGFTKLTEKYNKEGEYLKSYIVDILGSLAAEKTIDYVQKNLEKEMLHKNLYISNRYSPGYCNWQLNDQKQLFALLPDNDCKIILTDSSLMLPIKSVSGIIGIGKNMKKKSYACEICENKTCVYRRVREKAL